MTHTMTGSPAVTFDDDIPSSYVLDREMRDALRKPFPPSMIGQVNKGFGMVDFIGHAAITDRLNQAAPGWTYRVEPVVITGKDGLPHCMAVFGTMTVGGVTRQEVGDVEHMSRYGDELKKAISDFIVRGAMRFGVGLDLWSKEDLQESAPTRGRHGADAGGRVDTASSTSRTSSIPAGPSAGSRPSEAVAASGERADLAGAGADSSSEGTTTAATQYRGTTADPSDSSPAAGPPQSKPRGRGDGAATKGEEEREPGTVRTPSSSSPAGAKKYPIKPKDCLHMVGIDADGRCEDCGTQMAEASA